RVDSHRGRHRGVPHERRSYFHPCGGGTKQQARGCEDVIVHAHYVARSHPLRCVRCCSALPAGMIEASRVWELFNATKRDMVEAPCFEDTRYPSPVMLYLGAFNSIAREGLERGGLWARSFSGGSPASAGGSRAFLPLAVSFAAPGMPVPPSSFSTTLSSELWTRR